MKTLRLLILASVAAAVLLLPSCKQQKALVAGIDAGQVPLSFKDGKDYSGFEIDLASEAAKRAGYTISFVEIDWSSREKALLEKKVNSLWGTLTVTQQAKENILFTQTYLSDSQILIVPKNSSIADKNGLAGKSIGTLSGSMAAKVIESDSIVSQLESGSVNEFDDYDTLFLALDTGQIEAVAVDDTMGEYYIHQHSGNYRILPGTLSQQEYAVGVRRNDSAARNSLQKALSSMKADGTITKLCQKWFGKDLTK